MTSLGSGHHSGLSNHFWGHPKPPATAAVPGDDQANTDCSSLQLLLQNPRFNYVGEDIGDHRDQLLSEHHHVNQTMALSASSSLSLKTSGNSDSTTHLGSLIQYLIILSG